MSISPIIILYVFWISIFILAWCYFGYGLLIGLVNKLWRKKTIQGLNHENLPTVAILIAAYNEEACIEKKLFNSLSLHYPRGRLILHVITDGSTDKTPLLARAIQGITVHHNETRAGKIAALQRIIPAINEEILVFTDANCLLNQDALLNLTCHFNDPSVGAVTGEKKILSSPGSLESTEGLYWKYESWLKMEDSRFNTIVGAAGELFAIRRNLYNYLPNDTLLDDFMQSMLVSIGGSKVVYEPGAMAHEPASSSIKDEFERKTRISAGGFQSMKRLSGYRQLWSRPLLVFQFLSHRVLRWTLCPIALPVLFISSFCLMINPGNIILYTIAFYAQVFFYLLALTALIMNLFKSQVACPILKVPFYFTMMNAAVYKGFWRFLRGNQTELWKKAHRNSSMTQRVEQSGQVM